MDPLGSFPTKRKRSPKRNYQLNLKDSPNIEDKILHRPGALKIPYFYSFLTSSGISKSVWCLPSIRAVAPYDYNNQLITSDWFAGLNDQEWRLRFEAGDRGYCNLYLEVKVDENFVAQHVEFSFIIYVTKKTDKVRKFVTKNKKDTFTKGNRIIGFPKILSYKFIQLYLTKPLYMMTVLKPAYAPETCKDITGYVGLINEGTTCYMNSLLQTLFLITAFRQTVYSLKPTPNDRIPQALKRLFMDLEKSRYPPSTQGLLRSFGWAKEEWKVQHDVQEFNYTLSAALENAMKDDESKNSYSRLFKGKTLQNISCLNVKFDSKVYQDFSDVQLDIKFRHDIYESLDNYIAPMELRGEDKYDTEIYGLQDAIKTIKFAELPLVLQVQLKRFEFNPFSGDMNKLNDRFEFYDEIDLDKYVVDEIKGNNIYRLFSILVHSGTPGFGHYYSFISPKLDNNWYKFNDQSVDKAIPSQAINANWGGEMKDLILSEDGQVSIGKALSNTNAYMLIYIKLSEKDLVLPDAVEINQNKPEVISVEDDLQEIIAEIQIIENCQIALLSKEMITGYSGYGIYSWNDPSKYYTYSTKRTDTVQEVVDSLFSHLKISKVWYLKPGELNWTFLEVKNDEEISQFSFEGDFISHALLIESRDDVFRFIDNSWEISEANLESPDLFDQMEEDYNSQKECAFVVIKAFDEKSLNIVDADMIYEKNSTALCQKLSLKYLKPPNDSWLCIEKSNHNEISVHQLKGALHYASHNNGSTSINNGDVIIIGKGNPDSACERILDFQNSIEVQFTYYDSLACFNFPTHSKQLFDTFSLPKFIDSSINKKSSQLQIMKKIADALQKECPFISANHIDLLDQNLVSYRFTPFFDMNSVLQNGKIFYDISENDLLSSLDKLPLRVVCFNNDFEPIAPISMLVNNDLIIGEVAKQIGYCLTKEPNSIELFLYSINEKILLSMLDPNTKIESIKLFSETLIGTRVKSVEEMQEEMQNESKIKHKILVYEIMKNGKPKGKPYFIFVKNTETCQQLKQRILDKLGPPYDFLLKIAKLDTQMKKQMVVGDLGGSQEIFINKFEKPIIVITHTSIVNL
ncbi:UBP12 [Blepharisma stoltei]|uniref:USP domain-containing protein n=1 Tax=Blepharisma stoltei TaxID=1481888 RepID=A0AAU9IZH7_9CILI|nr:unnamed protein product [Blepharisma stoltei]